VQIIRDASPDHADHQGRNAAEYLTTFVYILHFENLTLCPTWTPQQRHYKPAWQYQSPEQPVPLNNQPPLFSPTRDLRASPDVDVDAEPSAILPSPNGAISAPSITFAESIPFDSCSEPRGALPSSLALGSLYAAGGSSVELVVG
jgi:hypothetical protein